MPSFGRRSDILFSRPTTRIGVFCHFAAVEATLEDSSFPKYSLQPRIPAETIQRYRKQFMLASDHAHHFASR
jgi:hypothetical protein